MYKYLILLTFLAGCCKPTYLTPAAAYNSRHEVKCKGLTYAQCINKFVNAKDQYEKQLDNIYSNK